MFATNRNLAPETVLPPPAPSDEPSPSIVNSYESPATTNSILPRTPIDAPPTEARYFVLDERFEDSLRQSGPADQQLVQLPSRSNSGPQSPSAAIMALNTPPTPNLPTFGNAAPQNPPQPSTAKRRRVE